MRAVAAAVVFALLLVAVPPAVGHAGEAHHVIPFTAVLGPGEVQEVPLAAEVGPLQGDWVFLVVAWTETNGTSATFEMFTGGTVAANWTLPHSGTVRLFTTVPLTADYMARLHNPSSWDTVKIIFYFDQSCNCVGKPLPAGFGDAIIMFNYDFLAGDDVEVVLNDPQAMTTRMTLARRTGAGSDWPEDFTAMQASEDATFEAGVNGAEDQNVHRFALIAPEDGTYFFVVEEKDFLLLNYTGPASLLILPEVAITPPSEDGFPFLGIALIVVVVAAVAVGALMVRRRAKPL
jgi:hypothetical protein